MTQQPRRSWRKILFVIGLLIGGSLVMALAAIWGPPQTWPAWLLTRSDKLQPTKVLVLLMGSVTTRTPHAISLYNQGFASDIVFADVAPSAAEVLGVAVNDADATAKLLRDQGIPVEHIHRVTTTVASTRDEAETLLRFVGENFPHTHGMILVTDWYHSRRAGWIFDKYRPEGLNLMVSPAMVAPNHPAVWYESEEPFVMAMMEYIKWLYYLIHY